MLDGLFYYFAGTGVVVGVKMDPEAMEEIAQCEDWDDWDDE